MRRRVYPFGFFGCAGFVSAGGLYLFVAKAVREVELELPAFIASGGPDILAGEVAGGSPVQGVEDIADGNLGCRIAFEKGFLETAVEAPH